MLQDLIKHLLHDLVAWCENDMLAPMFEGHFKAEVLRALLTRGYVIEEGCNKPETAWELTFREGAINGRKTTCTPRAQGGKRSDVRITKPIKVVLEVKVRPDLGSLAQARSDQFKKDFDNLVDGSADLMLIAFGPDGYRAMRGNKQNPQGRKASLLLDALLPPIDDICTDGTCVVHEGTYCKEPFVACAGKAANGKVVVAVTQRSRYYGNAEPTVERKGAAEQHFAATEGRKQDAG